MDIGLYTTSGIIPEFKYFQQQNIKYENYPDNRDEQLRYIREGLTDFVVVPADILDEEVLYELNENYVLVCEEERYQKSFGGIIELYKRKIH